MVADPQASKKRIPNPNEQILIDYASKIRAKSIQTHEEIQAALNKAIKERGRPVRGRLGDEFLQATLQELFTAMAEDGEAGFMAVWETLERDNRVKPEWRPLLDVPAPQEDVPRERPYQLRPLSFYKNRPKKEWAVHEIVFDRGTSLFVGPGGSGKSAFVLDMYLSRVCNRSFLGRAVKPAFLIWVAAESLDELYPRAEGWLISNGISPDDPLNMLVLDQRMPLNDAAETEKFIISTKEQLSEMGISPETHSLVIVFDTYSKCTPGADENNTKEVKIIVELIDRISTEIKTHVSIICHTNADGIIKGNKALRDGVDTVWMVSKNNETICLSIDKMRGAPEPHSIYACMRSIILDENNVRETAPVIFALDEKVGSIQFTPNAQKQMLAILASEGPMGVNDWQKKCEQAHGIKKSTFFVHKTTLVKNKLVTPPPEGATKGTRIEHAITEQGRELLESSSD